MTFINAHIGLRKVLMPLGGGSGDPLTVDFQPLIDWLTNNALDVNVDFTALTDWLIANNVNVDFTALTDWLANNELTVDFDTLTQWLLDNNLNVEIVNQDPIPVSFDPRITQYCLDGTYDGNDAIIRFWDDGKIEYCLLTASAWVEATDQKKLTCERTIEAKKVYFETVRLSSDLSNAATPWIPEIGNGIQAPQQGIPGNTYCIEGDYKGFYVRWQRETEEGAVLDVELDGINNNYGYIAGQGCLYMQDLFGVDSDNGEMYCQKVCFNAIGPKAFVELIIVRCL